MQMIETPAVPPTISTTLPQAATGNLLLEDFGAVLDDSDRRILIVDDEEPLRRMFAQYLSEQFVCTTAGSAEEALTHLAAGTYALVITDVMMPGRNGVELLREIKARYPDTAVIMISGVDRSQRVRDALRVGAYDYLIKPCDLDVLQMSVERALERRDLLRTARHYKADIEKQNRELALRTAELQRLQAQIIHSEKMASLGQLAAGVAHELNNPAGFIYGNMDILKEQLAGLQDLLAAYDRVELPPNLAPLVKAIKTRINYDQLHDDFVSIIADCREGAERIRDVVQNLRLFSRLDEAELKQIDLQAGIDSTIRLLSQYYSSGRLVLCCDYGELAPVSCYAAQLNQVWMNLLVNAAQAVPGKGSVGITTRQEGNWAVVTISDSGCGIPPDVLPRIFDPFYTTKPVGEGTGLGLSISYAIIQRHGGSIVADSPPGSGTTFTVRIPVIPEPAAPESN
jgi:two-component system, NtrC family, sensor kinase